MNQLFYSNNKIVPYWLNKWEINNEFVLSKFLYQRLLRFLSEHNWQSKQRIHTWYMCFKQKIPTHEKKSWINLKVSLYLQCIDTSVLIVWWCCGTGFGHSKPQDQRCRSEPPRKLCRTASLCNSRGRCTSQCCSGYYGTDRYSGCHSGYNTEPLQLC